MALADKTRLDFILDRVDSRHEVTFNVEDYSKADRERIIAAAESRGLTASHDGRFILVRDLREVR